MSYRDVAEAVGTVLASAEDSNGYQGVHYWLVQNKHGEYTVVAQSYGTCALCDTQYAIMDDDDPEEHWKEYVREASSGLTWYKTREEAIVATIDLESFGYGDTDREELRNALRKDEDGRPK